MSPRFNPKTSTWSAVNFKKHMTSMSCRLEPTIWSHDTGQQIPCFDKCQLLIITWMSNIKEVHRKPRLHVSINLLFGVWAPYCTTPSLPSPFSCVCFPRAIPLPMITMRKSILRFLFPYMVMGLRLAALWAAGALLSSIHQSIPAFVFLTCNHLFICPLFICSSTWWPTIHLSAHPQPQSQSPTH